MDAEESWGDRQTRVRFRDLMRRMLVVAAMVMVILALVGLWLMPARDPRVRAEREHGIKLPSTAVNIQCRGNAWHGFLDRGATALFEINGNDLAEFSGQFHVRSRRTPVRTSPADPLINGWNVWPQDARSHVPSNLEYGGFKRTWTGEAVPIEMLSCDSPTGDWLHVEFWKLPEASWLVKMYTDWN